MEVEHGPLEVLPSLVPSSGLCPPSFQEGGRRRDNSRRPRHWHSRRVLRGLAVAERVPVKGIPRQREAVVRAELEVVEVAIGDEQSEQERESRTRDVGRSKLGPDSSTTVAKGQSVSCWATHVEFRLVL